MRKNVTFQIRDQNSDKFFFILTTLQRPTWDAFKISKLNNWKHTRFFDKDNLRRSPQNDDKETKEPFGLTNLNKFSSTKKVTISIPSCPYNFPNSTLRKQARTWSQQWPILSRRFFHWNQSHLPTCVWSPKTWCTDNLYVPKWFRFCAPHWSTRFWPPWSAFCITVWLTVANEQETVIGEKVRTFD